MLRFFWVRSPRLQVHEGCCGTSARSKKTLLAVILVMATVLTGAAWVKAGGEAVATAEASISNPGSTHEVTTGGGRASAYRDNAAVWLLDQSLPPIMALPRQETSLPRRLALAGERTFHELTQLNVVEPTSFLASQLGFMGAQAVAATAGSAAVSAAGAIGQESQKSEISGLIHEDEGLDSPVEPLGKAGRGSTETSSAQPVPDSGVPIPKYQGGPRILIYNTHNAETYLPSSGRERLEGKNAGVTRVAAALAAGLEKDYGIATIRSDVIHDYPNQNLAYVNSAKTVETLLQANPSIQVVVDIHRDAGVPRAETVVIRGKKAARILFIAGSDQKLPFPTWQKNLAFISQLAAVMDELYPGLSKGVRQQEGRYNQHLHPRSILAEIGNSLNSEDEAMEAARLLASSLARVLEQLSRQ